MKRVLLSTDAVGGVWVYTLQLARMLAARGAAVDVAVLGPAVTAAQRREAVLAGVTLHETGLQLDWLAQAPAELAAATAGLVTLARRLGVNLVQLHTPALVGEAAWPAPVLCVVHSCVGTWWRALRGEAPAPADFAWRMAAVAAGLARADDVVAPTEAFAVLLREVYGARRDIGVAHNGRTELGAVAALGDGVLAAGRLWDEGKGIALLDRAAAVMAVPVRAAGPLSGPNGARIGLRAIQALGVLDEAAMTQALTAARIFASPALYEPFGLAVLEAAQAGLPLVLADMPSFRELWQGAALLLPPDEAAWAEALDAMHAAPDLCREWGGKARARAADYTAERFGAAMWARQSRLMEAAACASAA